MRRSAWALGLVMLAGCAVDTTDTSRPAAEGHENVSASAEALTTQGVSTHIMTDPLFVDITGTDLQVLVNYRAKGANAPADTNILSVLPLLQSLGMSVPQSTQQLLTVPLSTQFQNFWNGPLTNGQPKSLHDMAVDQIVSGIQQAVSKQGQQATHINVSVPTSGALTASVQGTHLVLMYTLPTVKAHFASTSPVSGGLIPDPEWDLTFDMAIEVVSIIPSSPCQLAPTAELAINNAHIGASNATAQTIEWAGQIAAFFSDQPTAIFQVAEGAIDGYYAANAGPLASTLSGLESACNAGRPYGLDQFGVFVNPANHTLNFRISHPVDPGPVLTDISSQNQLIGAQIALDHISIPQGGHINVSGTGFTPNQASAVELGWNDTISGKIVNSNIRINGSSTIYKARSERDHGNAYTDTGLSPNRSYTFQVQDCDYLTCSNWSNLLSVNTTSANTANALLTLQGGSLSYYIGTTTIGANGSFLDPIAIPATIAPGTYTLTASAGVSGTAHATLVISATNHYAPVLDVYYANTNTTVNSGVIVAFGGVTLRGEGYAPGPVKITLDTEAGTTLANVTADASGAFQASFQFDYYGVHKLHATELVNGTTLDATATVNAEALE